MNDIELKYFQDIREHRLGLAKSLYDPSMRGVLDVISNLYRDDAHFVYELLQNADDQKATHAKFILSETELIFIHNAPRHFTITDNSNHEEDKEKGILGNVNSILSIASSSKGERQDEVPIGKFGLGFKSVFLFTDVPEVYDENIRFSISNYIVPTLIENDHPLRKEGETLFRFRFKPGEEKNAYRKIYEKLRGLVNPILFLNVLKTIEWESDDDAGYYRLEEVGEIGSGKKLKYEVVSDETDSTLEMWKFDSPVDESKQLFVSVVYVLKDGELSSSVHPLYCYLPTANITDLPVILHAPFKLTGNRESIMADDPHNRDMISLLSKLLVNSLREICEIGERDKNPWIKDNILNFLPKHAGPKEEISAVNLNIEPLSRNVLEALKVNPMLWSESLCKYLLTSQSFVPDNGYLSDVYTPDILEELYGSVKGWVLPSIVSEIRKSSELLRLIGVERLTPEKILRRITSPFLNKRSLEWLIVWYKSLLKVPNLWEKGDDCFLRYQSIVKTINDGPFVPPYIKGKETPNVCFFTEGAEEVISEGLYLIPQELIEDDEVKSFFKRLGITGIDSFTMAEKVYLPKVNSDKLSFSERLQNLIWLIGIYDHNLTSAQQKIIKEHCKLPGYYKSYWDFFENSEVKLHNADNDFYFAGTTNVPFFEGDKLCMDDKDGIKKVEDFIKRYDAVHSPTVYVSKVSVTKYPDSHIPKDAQRPGYMNRNKLAWEWIEEPYIQNFEYFINNVAGSDPKKSSELIERLFITKYPSATYVAIYRGYPYERNIDPLYKSILRDAKWIDLATPSLRKWLDLPVRELQGEGLESIKNVLSESGIVSPEDVNSLLEFMDQRGVLKDFQLRQSIEEQKTIVSAVNKCSLRWFKEVLTLRLKYVEAGEKKDIDFLITRLLEALDTLCVDDDTDLREVLPENINVIFGPPGTGKTTEITHIISKMLEEDPMKRILVLTPTNAAAKVVAERLNNITIEASRGVDSSHTELCNELNELDIPIYDSKGDTTPSVLVSTVHYFAQTYSVIEGCYLHDLDWDAIFIDETSMVTLDYVLFALLKGSQINRHCHFYIVGDPLQLPPITNLDPFILEEAQLDEFNFYSFIGLTEFTEKPANIIKCLGDNIKIRLLATQYRSVQPLCEIMSKFAYNGKICSDFKGTSLNFPEGVPSVFKNTFTVIRFPVTKAGLVPDMVSIMDLDKFKGSNYQIYSALLVKEMLQKLFFTLHAERYDRYLSIGIITPYTAQKKLIEKLLNTNSISRDVNIDVYVNTVHQFQGDEFDIVLLVLNPPNMGMTPKDKILINKRYLINVATSRAKNSLIILYPDHSCKEENFIHVNEKGVHPNIEEIAKKVFNCKIGSLTKHSKVVEEELFGRSDYLSSICDVTYHEEVNLHEAKSETTYRFVKGGDTIDIIYSEKE